MPPPSSNNGVGVREGDPSGGELTTDINRLQPANAPDSSGADSQTNAACVEGSTESCGPSREEGICKFGMRTCTGGQWGECTGAVFAKDRDCSSTADNDCDGQPDDTRPRFASIRRLAHKGATNTPGSTEKAPARPADNSACWPREMLPVTGGPASAPSDPRMRTPAMSPGTTPTAMAGPTAAARASKAPRSRAGPRPTTVDASVARARVVTAPSVLARELSSRRGATALRRKTTIAAASPTTPSTRCASVSSAPPSRVVRIRIEMEMALVTRALRPAKAPGKTRRAASARAVVLLVRRSATCARLWAMIRTAMAHAMDAANDRGWRQRRAAVTPTTPGAAHRARVRRAR